MKNSYDDHASSELPTHLFEWAVGEAGDDGSTVASHVLNESSDRRRRDLERQRAIVEVQNDLADFGEACVDVLNEAGFDADFDIDVKRGTVKVMFEDVDGVYNERRAKVAHGVVKMLSEQVGGQITRIANPAYGAGGNVTVGMLSGIGFGGVPGLNPDYDVFAERRFETGEDLTANISESVVHRLNELSRMWDGDYSIYNEAVTITLREMGADERGNLSRWIEENRNRVGIPGTTLEEVLYDIHARIHNS